MEYKHYPYHALEDINLSRKSGTHNREFLEKELQDKGMKAVTVCFSDIEGRFHALDYDKKYFLQNSGSLTFDGSSIRGFTDQAESDLILGIDWTSWYALPSDVFAPGKMLVFGHILNQDGTPYEADIRTKLGHLLYGMMDKKVHVSCEIEGFLFEGVNAEKSFNDAREFKFATYGGYFDTLPRSILREFIDKCGEVQRAMGFENEKDHGEVACSQFEMNWKYTDALIAADQIQLYKLICRQVAANMGCTASFLPKPVVGVNGNGMHTNISIASSDTNLFYEENGLHDGLSPLAQNFINGILGRAEDLCLIMNSSVNSYRRLDPDYEAPNAIFSSSIDRGAMIRIPLANEKSTRIEVRSVAPDANPYLLLYSLIRAGTEGSFPASNRRQLPDNIYLALKHFKNSEFITKILGEDVKSKYAKWKQASADRCAKLLGTRIKAGEVMFHHEVTNQHLWQLF